jgi:hypothetical protein
MDKTTTRQTGAKGGGGRQTESNAPSGAGGGLGGPNWLDASSDSFSPASGATSNPTISFMLWQFLVALLDDPTNASIIAWTGRGSEFKLLDPNEVRENFDKNFLNSLVSVGLKHC